MCFTFLHFYLWLSRHRPCSGYIRAVTFIGHILLLSVRFESLEPACSFRTFFAFLTYVLKKVLGSGKRNS